MKRPTSPIASAINPDSVLVVVEAAAGESLDARSDEETSLLALIDGKRTVAEILHLSRMSGFVAMRRLRSLLERKVIRPAGRVVAATPVTGGGGQKQGRLGLTQDLTSAAKAFAASATRPGMAPPRPASLPASGRADEARPSTTVIDSVRPSNDRSTPLQGSISLPSVIIAFGADALGGDSRRSPTRKLASPERLPPPEVADPPAAAPPQAAQARPPSELIPTAAPRPSSLSTLQVQETQVMPRARGLSRRRSTPHSSEQLQAQELWISVTRRDWQTLAIVSAHTDGSALAIASALVEAGTLLRGKPVDLYVAEGGDVTGEWNWNGRLSRPVALPSGGLPPTTEKFQRVVALEPLATNPRGVTIAQSAEAVLMVAEQGLTDLRTARRAVEMVGRDRFIGCVMLSRR